MNEEIILEGVVGSTLYGLDTEDSDIDKAGIFIYPTKKILSLSPGKETFTKQEDFPDSKDGDFVYHELGKFFKLAIKGNPSVLELLYLPQYTTLNYYGWTLVHNRQLFLSSVHIKNAYGGYAIQQVTKLRKREAEGREGFGPKTKNRYAKHARHLFRLLQQGSELLTTGTLTFPVTNREELFSIGELSIEEIEKHFNDKFEEFDKITPVIPDYADLEKLNKLLYNIRVSKL